jgi:hypothetical protein
MPDVVSSESAVTLPMGDPAALGPNRVIDVESCAAMAVPDPSGWVPEGSYIRFLADPEQGPAFLHVTFDPGFVMPYHWHPHDTVYIITKGEFIVEGEGSYVPGNVRWVKGGSAYGPELTGPNGCEFYLITQGPFAVKNPAVEAPPSGTATG